MQVSARANDGVPRHGTHALRVCTTEAVLEEDLEGSRHGVLLSEGQGAYDEVGQGGRFRNRDYAAHPFASGRIRTVLLFFPPEAEREGLQRECRRQVEGVRGLCFDAEFRKVEVFSLGPWPVAGEDAGVCACGLSIKLDGKGVDGYGDVRVEEALHFQRTHETGGLG